MNRHHVAVNVDDWFAVTSPDSLRDTLVHELTHAYQHEVVMVRDGGDKTLDPTRGPTGAAPGTKRSPPRRRQCLAWRSRRNAGR